MSTTPVYDQLAATQLRLHHFGHLGSITHWDQETQMPAKGSEARAAALAELAALMHRMRTEPDLRERIERAGQEPLDAMQRANLREIDRGWRQANALPEALVQAHSLATLRCEHAWRKQRPANDWNGFVENFHEVLRCARAEAELLSQQMGVSRYDALMDGFEPGMTSVEVDRVFGDLKTWLPGLIEQAVQRQSETPAIDPVGPFPLDKQRALSERLVRMLGFDFDAGRLDVATHPFCGGVPEDVRLTTRYREDDFQQALMGTIHETGHGRYEQGRPRDMLGQPVSEARSAAIHESQSLSFEMQLGRSRGFIGLLAPMLVEAFGPQPAFEPENLYRLSTRVVRGLIRVDADEATYPAHIILRYEIERALIEGEIEPKDIPALWDEKMMALLGLGTRGDYKDGPLQDVHWPAGMFGYFPSYSLGAMYAAQWFATMRRQTPDLDARIAAGDLAPVFDWLRDNIWTHASKPTTTELTLAASGEALNPAHFRAHLERRYLGRQG
ncbi:MAG: carboxypeptidase M32 [Rhizobacter sp.]|nr:carboxypeptidase M32 [Rhizobacter sp.]